MIELRYERMGSHFEKHHIVGMPFDAVLHRFTAPDYGPAHDHPFGFHTTVLFGGYEEEVFDLWTGNATLYTWLPGTTHYVSADYVHRITRLPHGECWTLITPGPYEKTPGFYEVSPDGVYHRFWNKTEFTRIENGK